MSSQQPTDVTAIGDWSRLLDGKVAVVTGGGDGIGGAVSRLFAEHGAIVEIAEVDPARAEGKQAEIEAAGGTGAHVVDVTDNADVERFAGAVLARTVGSTCSSTTSVTITRSCGSRTPRPNRGMRCIPSTSSTCSR